MLDVVSMLSEESWKDPARTVRSYRVASLLPVLGGPNGLWSYEDHPDFPLGILRRVGP